MNNNTILGSSGYIGISGSIGITGSTPSHSYNNSIKGLTGSIGSQGIQGTTTNPIKSTINDIIEKYNNRFLLDKYTIEEITMLPIINIVDNLKFKDHIFKAKSMINITDDFKLFLNNIITEHRDTKIDKIINAR